MGGKRLSLDEAKMLLTGYDIPETLIVTAFSKKRERGKYVGPQLDVLYAMMEGALPSDGTNARIRQLEELGLSFPEAVASEHARVDKMSKRAKVAGDYDI